MDKGPELFYESWEDALKDDVRALGGTKAVGVMLWPELEERPEKASSRLSDRIAPDRRERLSDEQERMIMRQAREKRGWSAAMCFLADDCGFERPLARAPQDEMAALQRSFMASVCAQESMLLRMERLAGVDSVPPSQRVRAIDR